MIPRPIAPILGAILLVGLAMGLRTAGTNAPFPSADHAKLPYHVMHDWGWAWCFQTSYGPLQPAMTKLFALVVTAFGIPMNEGLWRLPLAIVGSILPLITLALVLELSRSRLAAWAAAFWVAVLPPLVSDARYTWGYESLGAACAAAALLAMLRYWRAPSVAREWLAGAGLAIYLWSHLLVYAFPLVLLLSARSMTRPDERASGAEKLSGAGDKRHASALLLRPGLILPSLLAGAISAAMYVRFGGGPISRILYKLSIPTGAFPEVISLSEVIEEWFAHAGYLPAALALATFAFAAPAAIRLRNNAAALWWWAPLFSAPLLIPFLFKDMPVGRYSPYLLQASFALALTCAVVALPWIERRMGRVSAIATGALCGLWLFVGTLDSTFNNARLAGVTGIRCTWGARHANPGYKTLGWYVQTYVTAGLVVATLHDFNGLELIPASYYTGRPCLAYADMTPAQSGQLVGAFLDRVDVIVHERRLGPPPTELYAFELVARITRDGEALIDIHARRSLRLARGSFDVTEYDARFDESFGPREIGVPIPWPPRLPRYREIAAAAIEICEPQGP